MKAHDYVQLRGVNYIEFAICLSRDNYIASIVHIELAIYYRFIYITYNYSCVHIDIYIRDIQ